LLSVVVPVHDRASLLRRALDSLIRQGSGVTEVIVVDDGSTEDVKGVVETEGPTEVRYVWQPQGGANAARNHGASLARTDRVTFLDADDEVLPGWADALNQALTAGAHIACCGFEHRTSEGQVSARLPGPLTGPLEGASGMFNHAGTYALRKDVFEAVGGFAERLRAAQHTELSYRLVPLAVARGWRIANIDAPLVRYYANLGGIRGDDAAVLEGAEYILRAHKELLRPHPRHRATRHATAGYRAARLRQFPRARAHFRSAVAADPRTAKHWVRYGLTLAPTLAARVWG
jgi:glycosyltransferase involved in cell wall biosynthesis